ncbi:MAG: inositol monophosphatase family protein, partial [Halobacteria archaeon]|nr:inositol monophosphatase family protein [Halobacteria archaeon]
MGLLRDVALGVEEAVEPLFDDDSAAEVVGMGADGTPTKRIDEVAEKAALDLIEEHGDVRVVSEERGEVVYGEPEATVALDPLDGTYNASNGVPFYSVSVALVDGDSVNDTVESHVRELTTGVSYTATRGDGAFCDGEPIEVEGDTTPSKMTLGGVYNIEGFDPARFKRVRLLGCSSLELCYTAAGRFDAFADLRSR